MITYIRCANFMIAYHLHEQIENMFFNEKTSFFHIAKSFTFKLNWLVFVHMWNFMVPYSRNRVTRAMNSYWVKISWSPYAAGVHDM